MWMWLILFFVFTAGAIVLQLRNMSNLMKNALSSRGPASLFQGFALVMLSGLAGFVCLVVFVVQFIQSLVH